MNGPNPPERRRRCPTCGAGRYNKCRNGAGQRVDWYHADRINLADAPVWGHPRRRIPPQVRADLAAGVSIAEVARRHGVHRSVLERHGLLDVRPAPPPLTLPPEVPGMLASGLSIAEISRRTGLSRSALGRRGVGRSGLHANRTKEAPSWAQE